MAVALVPEGPVGAGRRTGGVSGWVLRSELGLRCLSTVGGASGEFVNARMDKPSLES